MTNIIEAYIMLRVAIAKERNNYMKILYLINHAGKAGTEKYIYNLVSYFHKKHAECYFAYNEAGLLSEQMAEKGIKSYRLPMKNPFDLKAAKKLAKICCEEGIDIVHTQYPRENYIAILSKLFGSKIKAVYTCHLTYYPSKIWYLMNRLVMPFNDRIIAVCNYGKSILGEIGAPLKKVTVIYNGIMPSGDPVHNKDIINELNLPDDTFVITTLARHNEEKGLPFLVRSMKALKNKTDRPFVCLIAGDGPLFSQTCDYIEKTGASQYVLPLGFRSDSENILNGSHVFVNSAKCNEALSFAILEGMGHGLPIVATNIGGNPDIVKDEYGNGALVSYGDEEAMADAIYKLMTNEEYYKSCSENSLKTVRNVFNLEKLLEDTFNIYTF